MSLFAVLSAMLLTLPPPETVIVDLSPLKPLKNQELRIFTISDDYFILQTSFGTFSARLKDDLILESGDFPFDFRRVELGDEVCKVSSRSHLTYHEWSNWNDYRYFKDKLENHYEGPKQLDAFNPQEIRRNGKRERINLNPKYRNAWLLFGDNPVEPSVLQSSTNGLLISGFLILYLTEAFGMFNSRVWVAPLLTALTMTPYYFRTLSKIYVQREWRFRLIRNRINQRAATGIVIPVAFGGVSFGCSYGLLSLAKLIGF